MQLRSGRILAPVSLLSNRPTGIWVSVAPYSDDDGLTWHAPVGQVAFNTGATSEDESGPAEPVAVELKDGRVWLLPRSQDGFQWEAFSSDGGLHWTEPRHTRFVSNNSAMAPLRLSDGRLVLLWNNCSDGPVRTFAERAVLAAAISADDGRTWAGYREVARVTAPACVGYPSAAEAGDGRFVVFCGDDYLVKADPDWLTRTSFAEDFSQGIGRWSTLGAEGVEVVADPDGGSGKVLRLRKPRASAAAGACLNFPFGARGELTAAVRIERGFQGARCPSKIATACRASAEKAVFRCALVPRAASRSSAAEGVGGRLPASCGLASGTGSACRGIAGRLRRPCCSTTPRSP